MRGGYRHHATCKGAPPRLIPGKGCPLATSAQFNAQKISDIFSALLQRRASDMSSNFADISYLDLRLES